jgi:uncharacterized membrane protein
LHGSENKPPRAPAHGLAVVALRVAPTLTRLWRLRGARLIETCRHPEHRETQERYENDFLGHSRIRSLRDHGRIARVNPREQAPHFQPYCAPRYQIGRNRPGGCDRRPPPGLRRSRIGPVSSEDMGCTMAATPLIEKWENARVRHEHRHPQVVNVAELQASDPGLKVADRFASVVGSWRFIIVQSVILAAWVAMNVLGYVYRWDPYPFILLNLVLSFQAAYAAPIIMMSQNRQADKDRLAAEVDYQINVKAEEEVKAMMRHLEQQDELMIDILRQLDMQHQKLLEYLAHSADNGASPQPNNPGIKEAISNDE